MKKRFLKKLLLFLLLAYAVPALFITFGGMCFHEVTYPMSLYKQQKIETAQSTPYDLLILGDSCALAGLLPSVLSPNALSLAIGGSSSIEAYYVLKHYLEHTPAPKQILLSITPLHFSKESYFWGNNVKYSFLSLSDSKEVLDRSIDMKSCPFPCEKGPLARYKQYWKRLKYRLALPHLFKANIIKARVFGKWAKNREKWEYLKATNGHSFYGTNKRGKGLILETKHKTFRENKLLVRYTTDLLDLARKHKIRVVFINMAVSDKSYSKIAKVFLQNYLRFLNKLQQQYPEVLFDMSYPHYPFNYFGDSSHMNAFGAHRFSQYIRDLHFSEGPPSPAVLKQQEKWKVVIKAEEKPLEKGKDKSPARKSGHGLPADAVPARPSKP